MINIRLKEDVGPYEAGECIKAVLEDDGMARPWSGGGMVLYPEEFDIVISEDVFNKLLN